MKVKLLREILVGPSDAMPTRGGTVVDLSDDQAKQYIANGFATEVKGGKESTQESQAAAKEAGQVRESRSRADLAPGRRSGVK